MPFPVLVLRALHVPTLLLRDVSYRPSGNGVGRVVRATETVSVLTERVVLAEETVFESNTTATDLCMIVGETLLLYAVVQYRMA
eukprot:3510248-Rhodomonas_salina.2